MTLLNFNDTKNLLLKYNIPFVETNLARNENEAVLLAEKNGYPVALKIFGSQIFHRVDVGGIKTGIRNQGEVKEAFSFLSKINGIDGVLVQEMANGQEIFIGMKRDPQFGPVLMFGLGGIFVEVLKDISFRVCPITEKEALAMIKEIKGYPILSGIRGKKGVNIENLVKILVRLSSLSLKEENIQEIDLNPIIVNEKEAKAVDFKFFYNHNV
jgi:acetyl-CoA synthetase (ADP-forming)